MQEPEISKKICLMADVHDKKTRSYNMSQIRATNTKPEMVILKFLHAQGFRYKLHDKKLPGKPDIVLPKYKTAILIHGCFWRGHESEGIQIRFPVNFLQLMKLYCQAPMLRESQSWEL